MFHPSRGGVRGGRDQFSWEDVKGDKHRQNYLGHSVMAPIGRWQQGKDLLWYSKDKSEEEMQEIRKAKAKELETVKNAEEEAMMIALGLKPPKRETQTEAAQEELNKIMKNRQDEMEDDGQGEAGGKGLGYGRLRPLIAPETTTRIEGTNNDDWVPVTDTAELDHEFDQRQGIVQGESGQGGSSTSKKDKKKDKKDKSKKKKKRKDKDREDGYSSDDKDRKKKRKEKKEKKEKKRRRHDSDSESDSSVRKYRNEYEIVPGKANETGSGIEIESGSGIMIAGDIVAVVETMKNEMKIEGRIGEGQGQGHGHLGGGEVGIKP